MSADNYIVVEKYNGKYYAPMYFASDEEPLSLEQEIEWRKKNGRFPLHAFDSFAEAWDYANSEYTEYGVSFSDEVANEIKEKMSHG